MTEFNEIYNNYFKDVYKYIFSLCKNEAVAEEITQETFFKVLNNIDKFNGHCKLYVWLCQIAKNTYFSYSKKEKKSDNNADVVNIESFEDLEQNLFFKETSFELHKILHTLEEPYKEVFSLRLFGELSFAHISELFGKTESWARVTYHRAKLELRRIYNETVL